MDDWNVFFDSEDFADEVHWETQDGEIAEISGIFEARREVVLSGNDAGVSAVLPVLTVAQSQIPETADQGDDIEVLGENYLVADLQPDGTGVVRILLERK